MDMSSDHADVLVRVGDRVIPTYVVGAPDKNPMFLENRVYQGSSGVIYPHPIIERVADEKTDVSYMYSIDPSTDAALDYATGQLYRLEELAKLLKAGD